MHWIQGSPLVSSVKFPEQDLQTSILVCFLNLFSLSFWFPVKEQDDSASFTILRVFWNFLELLTASSFLDNARSSSSSSHMVCRKGRGFCAALFLFLIPTIGWIVKRGWRGVILQSTGSLSLGSSSPSVDAWTLETCSSSSLMALQVKGKKSLFSRRHL